MQMPDVATEFGHVGLKTALLAPLSFRTRRDADYYLNTPWGLKSVERGSAAADAASGGSFVKFGSLRSEIFSISEPTGLVESGVSLGSKQGTRILKHSGDCRWMLYCRFRVKFFFPQHRVNTSFPLQFLRLGASPSPN